MPRPQPSSSGQISPLVAVIAGAATAAVLLAAVLAVALRVHCRRARLRAAHAGSNASGGHRGSETGAASAAGSETLLLVKSEQMRSATPVFGAGGMSDADDRNPDLIPVHEGNWAALFTFYHFIKPNQPDCFNEPPRALLELNFLFAGSLRAARVFSSTRAQSSSPSTHN